MVKNSSISVTDIIADPIIGTSLLLAIFLYIHGSFLCYQIIGPAVAGLPDLLLRLCGTAGTSGTAGISGTSVTAGASGTAGTSGTSDTCGKVSRGNFVSGVANFVIFKFVGQ